MSTFGTVIKKLREKRGLTQKELAEQIGTTAQSLGRYETDQRTPDIFIADKLASYFNVSTDYLLGRTEITTPPEEVKKNIEEMGFSENGIKYLKNLDPELKKILEQMFFLSNNISNNNACCPVFSNLLLLIKQHLEIASCYSKIVSTSLESKELLEAINKDNFAFRLESTGKLIEYDLIELERCFSDVIKLMFKCYYQNNESERL